MASGRPVLAAVHPASQAADIVRDAAGGVLVAPDDPEALAEAARGLTNANAGVLAELGSRNRAYAEEHFDQRKIVAAHEAFMLKMMTVHHASAPAA
jgi:colanic acid biosynthesis glycosyl transferase WcaI